MSLKFKKPEIKQQRLKAMFFGEMGTGKSTVAAQFPMTAYVDTEDTSSKAMYAKLITDNGGDVLVTGDFDEILEQVKALMTTKHNYKTLVIDSLTIPYENLVIECERKVGSEYGRGTNEANKKMKMLVNLLLRLDMNIICTLQSKREYAGPKMEVVGNTFAGYNRLGYMFDLVFETQVRGNEHFAVTRKSRLEEFPMRESFKFTYEEVLKRLGSAIEKDPEPQQLADEKEIKEVKRLIDLLKVPEETYTKWLEKYNADEFEEMPQDAVVKIIDYLKSKIIGE